MPRRHYSDNDKATALAALDANGGNLKRTARETNVPVSTLQRWTAGSKNAAIPDLRTQKRAELSTLFEDEIYAIFEALPAKRHEASYQQLATAAGIYTDKMRLLRGLPTEIVQMLPDVMAAIETLGMKPSDVFNEIIQQAASKQQSGT